jgi:hypothetical protein
MVLAKGQKPTALDHCRDAMPLAQNCTQVLVWHTKADKHLPPPAKLQHREKYEGTNLPSLIASM